MRPCIEPLDVNRLPSPRKSAESRSAAALFKTGLTMGTLGASLV